MASKKPVTPFPTKGQNDAPKNPFAKKPPAFAKGGKVMAKGGMAKKGKC
jgi:hypothetical protein